MDRRWVLYAAGSSSFVGKRWKMKLNEMKMKACDEIERVVTRN